MKKWTPIFIIMILIAIGIYDVLAVVNSGTEATISSVVINWSYEFPAFTFLVGFAMGHLFWKIRPVKSGENK